MKYRCLYSNRYGKSVDVVVNTVDEAVDFVLKHTKMSKEDAAEMISEVTLINSMLLDIDPYHNNKSILIEGMEEKTIDFKEIRERSGMNLTQFGEYFGIPYRTLQHWEYGTRTCPKYLLDLIEYKLKQEGILE